MRPRREAPPAPPDRFASATTSDIQLDQIAIAIEQWRRQFALAGQPIEMRPDLAGVGLHSEGTRAMEAGLLSEGHVLVQRKPARHWVIIGFASRSPELALADLRRKTRRVRKTLETGVEAGEPEQRIRGEGAGRGHGCSLDST